MSRPAVPAVTLPALAAVPSATWLASVKACARSAAALLPSVRRRSSAGSAPSTSATTRRVADWLFTCWASAATTSARLWPRSTVWL